MNKDCSYDEAINVYDDMLKAFKTSGIRQFNSLQRYSLTGGMKF